MKILILILTITFIGCFNSNFNEFEKVDIQSVDSIRIYQISKTDYFSVEQILKLNKKQEVQLIDDMNRLKGASPWKFIPEYIIKIHLSDSIRTFRTLGGRITEKNDWALDLNDENYFKELFEPK